MKLISMTDFVLEQWETANEHPQEHLEDSNYLKSILNYANFLKKPLTLEMFVPCDLDGNILEHVLMPSYERIQYLEAKERVLFEGFYLENGIVFTPDKQVLIQKSMLEKMIIENLVGIKYNLTESSKKQLGL